MRRIKRFDFFRRPKDDLEKSTLCGAVLSILTVAAVVLLALSEISNQSVPRTEKHVVINSGSNDSQSLFAVNVDIAFLSVPCAALSFTMRDLSGKNYTLSHSELEFDRLSSDGARRIPKDYVDPAIEAAHREEKMYVKFIMTGAKNRERCRAHGEILVNKVPGSITFSHSLKKDLMKRVRALEQELFDSINLSHRISHLFFSDLDWEDSEENKNKTGSGKKGGFAELDALEGSEFVHNHVVSCSYYLKVIPVVSLGAHIANYQYSYHVDCTVTLISPCWIETGRGGRTGSGDVCQV